MSGSVARVWSSWASEIAADAFAFAHTGYASVAALHDVVASEPRTVLQFVPGDPHPTSFLRVLLGVEMCRYFYGSGPWDDLSEAWLIRNPVRLSTPGTARLIQLCLPILPQVVKLTLDTACRGFGNRPLRDLVQPERVSPATLLGLESRLGEALYTSMHWVWTEALRTLALTGWHLAIRPVEPATVLKRQDEWMLRLGGVVFAGD